MSKVDGILIISFIIWVTTILILWIVLFGFWGAAKQATLNAFLQEHDAEVVEAQGNSWLLKIDDDIVELNARLQMEYLDVPSRTTFHDKGVSDVYIAYYKVVKNGWERRIVKVPSEMIKEDGEIFGVSKLEKENLETSRLGSLSRADNIVLGSQTLETLAVYALLAFLVCAGSYFGIKKMVG